MAQGVAELTDESFETTVTGAQPVVVDFWASWCGPCRMLAPVVEQLAKDYAGKVTFAKVNVDDHTKAAAKLRIMNIPTLLFFKGGQEVDRVVGVVPREDLAKRVDRLL